MRLMLSQTSSITEFRLKCQKLPVPSVSRLWLRTLIFLNLEVLEISLSSELCPPTELFVSQTLGVLKLCGPNITLKFNPQSVHLPKLKVLHLKDLLMQLYSENLMFAEGYPVIQDLRLERIRFGISKHDVREPSLVAPFFNLNICLSSLLNLAIVQMNDLRRIDMDTPNLQHLIVHHCPFEYSYDLVILCRCDSIVSVDINEYPVKLFSKDIFTVLLNHLNNVKELRISKNFLEIFNRLPSKSLPQFSKLTKLEVTAYGESIWRLLRRAPILKTLVYDMGRVENCLLPVRVPACFSKNLRDIKIKSFKGSEPECAAVMYLMENAAVLEKMTIALIRGLGIQKLPPSTLKQLIEQKPRSPNCHIQIL